MQGMQEYMQLTQSFLGFQMAHKIGYQLGIVSQPQGTSIGFFFQKKHDLPL
jgi:hypothetical protein